MAIFTSVKNNLSGLFRGLKDFGNQFKVPSAPVVSPSRPDSYSAAGLNREYTKMLSGRPQTPKREVIDAILSEILDQPLPPPPPRAKYR